MNHKTTSSNTTFYKKQPTQHLATNSSFSIIAFTFGLIAGDLAALSFFILQLVGLEYTIGWKCISYGLLGIVIVIALNSYDHFLEKKSTFKEGMVFALQVSLFAGFTLCVINTFIFYTDANLVFLMYGKEVTNFAALLTINSVLFLEIMTVGLIFTLIALQYYKSKPKRGVVSI